MRIASDLVSVVHLRRGRWLALAALAALWIGAGAAFAAGRADFCWTPFVLLAGTSLVFGYTRGRSIAGAEGDGETGSLTIEGGVVEVEVGGEVRARFACAEIVSGWTEPDSWTRGDTAVLVTRGGVEVRVALPDRVLGAEVLLAAGVAAEQRAVKIHVRPGGSGADRTLRLFLAIVMAVVFAACLAATVFVYVVSFDDASRGAFFYLGEVIGVVSCARAGACLWILVRGLLTTTLIIGADGVVVERLLGRGIVRRGDLDGASVELDALLLHRVEHPPVRIRASLRAAMAAVERIHEVLRTSAPEGTRLEGLERRGRSTAAWIGALRALGTPPPGYRTASVARADLVAAVKDGAVPAERRVAAAVALSAGGDEEARAALRVAVDTCVDDGLRRALEQAAAGEMEAALEAALDEVAPRAARRA